MLTKAGVNQLESTVKAVINVDDRQIRDFTSDTMSVSSAKPSKLNYTKDHQGVDIFKFTHHSEDKAREGKKANPLH